MYHLSLLLDRTWVIVCPDPHPVSQAAATTLQRLIQRCGGPELPLQRQLAAPQILLRADQGSGDGFRRYHDADGLVLHAESPRGLHYAVFDLAEQFGYRNLSPDPADEVVPYQPKLRLPEAALVSRPAFAQRTLVLADPASLANGEAWLRWAVANRLNRLLIHVTGDRLSPSAIPLAHWRRQRAQLLPLIAATGLYLELGGHLLEGLLPAALRRRFPVLNRMAGGQRHADLHPCSAPAALAIISQQAARLARAYPEVAGYHLWPAARQPDHWCQCAVCATRSPAEQALRITNALAEGITRVAPSAHVTYLAYHETAEALSSAPHPAVELLFAPRDRSYAHGLAAEQAPRNHAHRQALAGLMGTFTPERTSVLGYYNDDLFFKGAAPPLSATLTADLRALHAQAIGGVALFQLGLSGAPSVGSNPYLFARLAWDPNQPPEDLLAEYAAHLAPAAPAHLVAAANQLANAWEHLLALTASEVANPAASTEPHWLDRQLATLAPPLRRALLSAAPADLLDLDREPEPIAAVRLDRLEAGVPALIEGQHHWEALQALHHGTRLQRLRAEQARWQASSATYRYLLARQRLAVRRARGAPVRDQRLIIAEARAAARAAADPARAPLLAMWLELPLAALADRIAGPIGQLQLRWRFYQELLRAWLRPRQP